MMEIFTVILPFTTYMLTYTDKFTLSDSLVETVKYNFSPEWSET
jgi:hypothetical protein